MKVVYTAGPYNAPTHWGIEQNIQRARVAAAQVWALGAACICPHAMTAHMSGCCPEENFYEGDLEIVRRCDALLMIEGWENSTGAKREKDEADAKGIPVFFSLATLKLWLGDSHE